MPPGFCVRHSLAQVLLSQQVFATESNTAILSHVTVARLFFEKAQVKLTVILTFSSIATFYNKPKQSYPSSSSRVFHANAPSNRTRTLQQVCMHHEHLKQLEYEE